jgi:hypothetical protein
MIYVLGVDPGLASGVAFLSWDEDTPGALPEVVWTREADEDQFGDVITDALKHERDGARIFVVCERFIINARTVQNSQAPWSLEQIGVLKHVCRKNNYPKKDIAYQAPADAKSMFPNPALKKIGTWHVGGGGHANDAIRHALLRLVKAGWVPRVLL